MGSAELCITRWAQAQAPQCPKELNGQHIDVHAAQSGWRGLAANTMLLERAGIVVGPPDVVARAELRGGEQRINRHTDQTRFPGLRDQSQKWLICAYGRGGDIEQAYRLPDIVSQCLITTTRRQLGNDIRINCE